MTEIFKLLISSLTVLQHKTLLKTGQGYLRTEAKENIRSLERDTDKPMEITKY
jgi:hypothetical protein